MQCSRARAVHTLHARLETLDPAAAERINLNDRKRITRALEVHHLTGRPISEMQKQWADEAQAYRYDAILIGLRWATEAINPRINARVKAMFSPADGSEDLIVETRRLRDAGLLGRQAAEGARDQTGARASGGKNHCR